MCCRVEIGRGLLTATALEVCALILGETGLYPRIDTGLDVTGRGLLTATDHVVSVHVPQLAGEVRSYARGERYRSGAGCQSPAHSGAADDDQSSAFESVDFDRDDSFRSVLGLIRSFHAMEEPAGVPSARRKTSLASTSGLMSEISPAFTLPASPLVRSLLDDTNLALAKFLEDQTVHGFLPVPGRRHRRYYRTSSSFFPGPYTVPPGFTSLTLEKVSEAKKRSVSLSASQISSMESMLSGVCEVSSWLNWWLSTCGGFRSIYPTKSVPTSNS